MVLHPGTQIRLITEATTAAGVTSKEGSIQSDSLLVTVFANSVTSGSLQVTVYTLTDNGKELEVITFPAINAPSTELLLKKSAVSMQRYRVVATYTGTCDYEIYVRAVEGAGESSVRIVGPANLETGSTTITTTAGILIPASLVDRQGVTLKNYSGTGTLFVSESLAKLPSQAWPIAPGEVWSLDIASGVTLYAVSSSGNIDVRIAQAGG